MKNPLYRLLATLAVLGLAALACQAALPGAATPPSGSVPASGDQPYEITGTFDYSNDIITTYYVEQAVALVDMYGFVKRDKLWKVPVGSQTLGFLSLDAKNKKGTYTLQLPAQPTAQLADVDNNGQADKGVQIFAVSYWPNLVGGPYSEGDDPSFGWPSYLASVKTDTENKDEVIAGSLVVWAPDANQKFPTGFGADKLLFTADDPTGPLPAGYSVVNLDAEPFTVSRDPKPDLTLYEPKDVAIKDFSGDSYTGAFDKMFAVVRKEYAFNDVPNKPPDWDKLYAALQPRVADAEKNKDAKGFYEALRDFTWAFRDGHVGLSGGDLGDQDFTNATSGGYGFAIRPLDDGRVIVIFVLSGGPAAKAGMKVGAEVTQFNGKPIKDAIAAAQSYSTQSSDFGILLQKSRYLLATQPGTQASVTFQNKGEASKTASLTSIAERDSFRRTSLYYGADPAPMLPVDFKLINSGNALIGYVTISSNYDDLNLIVRLFQRALDTFKANQVNGIIIDMRYNSGGANLGLAGFLTGNEIPMGQLEYYSDSSGKFEPEGPRDRVLPNVEQYHFDKEVLLVGPACFSACELESYGFSQVPGMVVVGQYPTAGVEAEVARGQFLLPEGMSLQVPTGRFKLPDGNLFLEGKGVPPTIKVPVDEAAAISSDDVVLQYGEDVISGKRSAAEAPLPAAPAAGVGVKPSGPPTIMDVAEVQAALSSTTSFLEQKASERYAASDYADTSKTFTYTINLANSEPLLWTAGWCATTQAILDDNFKHLKIGVTVNGKPVPDAKIYKEDVQQQGQFCRSYYAGFTDWKGGENHVTGTVNFTAAINDGTSDYKAGKQTFEYTVIVAP